MAEIKDKLVTAESLKNVYDTLNNNINRISDKTDNLPQPDWNQNDTTAADYVKNRPFYEESKTLFEWDGNTEGLDAVDFDGANVYRVPNIEYVSSDNFIGALAVASEGSEIVITDEDINPGSNGCFFVGGIIYIPYDNFNYEGIITFPKAGAYHIDTEVSGGTYFKSIKNTVIKKIDDKYLPDNSTVFTVTETSSGVVDKTDDEIAAAILHGDIVKLHSKNRNNKILSLYSYQNSSDGTILSPFLFTSTSIDSDLKISSTIKASVSNQTVKYTRDETLININSKVFELTNNMMTKPSTASVGQILTIAGIDESGSPTKLVAENITDLVDTTPIILSPTSDEFSSGTVTSYGFSDILTALQSGKPVYISFENVGLEGRAQIISYSRNETLGGYKFTVVSDSDILNLLFTSQ